MQGVLVFLLLVIPACFAATCSPIISNFAGQPDTMGYNNSSGENALFSRPRQMVLDPDTGDLYVADSDNYVLRIINSFGETSTLFTAPDSQDIWGIAYNPSPKGLYMCLSHKVIFYDLSTNHYKIIASNLNVVFNGVYYDIPSNTLYWTAYYTRVYYKVDPFSASPVHILFTENSQSWGLLVYNSNIYFGATNKVMQYNLTGVSISVLAGTTTGYLNGPGNLAQFSSAVSGVALVPNNDGVYVTDFYNSLIRRVGFDGTTSTVAGIYQSTTFNSSSGAFAQCAEIYAHPLLSNFYYVSDEFGVRLWYWSPPLISNISATALTSPYQVVVTWVNLVPANTIDGFVMTVLNGLGGTQIYKFESNNTYTFPADPQDKIYTIKLEANNNCGPSNDLSVTVEIPV